MIESPLLLLNKNEHDFAFTAIDPIAD